MAQANSIQICFVIAKASRLYVIGAFRSGYGGYRYAEVQAELSSKGPDAAELGCSIRRALSMYYLSPGIETEKSSDVLDDLSNGKRTQFIRHAMQVLVKRSDGKGYVNEGFFAHKGTGFDGLTGCTNSAPENCSDEELGSLVIALLSKIERVT